ncbi:PAS domain S-box protein [Halostella sp. JP-L12]|uniref:PAS domain-containing protein n=1 Tax=Halostella TaxID=1843185 RepID=UPI000EF7B2FC|nr:MULTISPECIES: PAS domain-containing protein [Halostella]NHN46291.1 PAS domain S-box protein [Halostella sp. JP-L12]
MDSPSPSEAELEARVRQQEIVAELGQRALEAEPLDELLRDAAALVAETLNAEYCRVLELLPDGEAFLLRQGAGWPAESVGEATVSAEGNTQAGFALRSEEPVVVDDRRAEDRFDGDHLLADNDVGSGISVPVGPADEPWGTLGVFATARRSFTERDVTFVRSVANALASAAERERDERQLRQMERRYEAVFEDPNILVGLLEPDGTVLDINGTAMEYIDADLDAVTGEAFWETPWWGEGDDVAADVREWTMRAAAGEYVEFEADLTRPDGERYTLNGVFRPVTDDDGEVVSILVSDRDVSERKERERELEESEQRYRALIEHFPNGAVALVDEELRYQTVGGHPRDVADVTAEEIEGRPVTESVQPKLADELVPRYEAALEGESDAFEIDLDDRIYQFQVVPVRDEDGEAFAALGMSQDVTDRKRAERKLQRNNEQLKTLFDVLPVGVIVADADGRIVEANDTAHEIWGGDVFDAGSVDEYERYPVRRADSGKRVEPAEMTLARVVDGEEVTDPDIVEIEAADGERRIVRAEGMPVRDERGEVTRGVITLTDITERRESQRALEESERRYRTLVENFPNGAVGLFNEDLEYTAVGGELLDTLDVDPEDRIGHSIRELHPEGLLDEIEPYFHAALAGETNAFEIEFRGRHLSAHTLPIRDADGEVSEGMLVVQDVTERKERERALEESEAKFRMLAENLDEVVWMSDPDTREILYINPAYERVFGRDRDSVYENPFSFLEAVHPDDRERVERAYDTTPEEGFDEEYRIVTPDGETRWLDVQAGIVHNDRKTRVVGIAEDITERKERERALEESERRYRTLVEDFPNGAVALFDDDLQYTAVGGQLLTSEGIDPDDRIGRSVRELYPDELLEEVEPNFRAALAGESNTFEIEYHDRHLFSQTLPVRNADDEVFAGMLVVQDVTERREYERKLEESNERLEQFAYAASHDLQEPLRMVSSYLQLIEDRYADELEADGREFLEFAVDGADRMRDMIEGLLEYSRVDTRGDPFEPVELNDVLADVRDDLQVKIEESDAAIAADDLPRVNGDASQLNQVFQNLLSNAIEYSGDAPPRIRVAADRADGGNEWVISVSDEGIGIDPDDADRVFEVFQSLHGPDDSGTGIGLALVKRIVERHGGDVRVESEPGEGATFSFTLPDAADRDE